MLQFLRTLLGVTGRNKSEKAPGLIMDDKAPLEIVTDGANTFPIAKHITEHYGFPIVDWVAVTSWIDRLGEPDRAQAWTMCERAWLLRFRDALGPGYHLAESEQATLLSSFESNLAHATLEMMEHTLKRIVFILDGIAQVPPWGKDILIVFDGQDEYYRYVSNYYPESGEFAFSGGMYIGSGCGHFVTVKSDLRSIEPVIAHEMTHGCVSYLPLPLWLNEGIAVNTERRLVGAGSSLYTPREMHHRHRNFWSETEIQEFWSGKSFTRIDDGNSLSYDLARIIVEQMAKGWGSFREFVLAADQADAGAAAAQTHLGIDLGEFVCALIEKEFSSSWTPDPNAWKERAFGEDS